MTRVRLPVGGARRDAAFQISSGAAQQVAVAVTGVVVARALDPAGRGEFAVATNTIALGAQLAGFGIASALTYYAAQGRRVGARDLGKLAWQRCVAAAALSVLVGRLFLTDGGSPQLWALSGVAAMVLLCFQWLVGYMHGARAQSTHAVMRSIPVVLFAAIAPALLLTGSDSLLPFLTVWGASVGAGLIAAGVVIRRTSPGPAGGSRPVDEIVLAREIVHFGRRGFAAQISPIEAFRLDVFLGAALLMPAGVGLYAAAAGLVNLPRFIAEALANVLFPRSAKGHVEMKQVARVLGYYSLAGLTAALGLVAAAPTLLPLLFGEDFAAAVPLVLPLSVAAVLLGARRISQDVLRAAGRPELASMAEYLAWPVLALAAMLVSLRPTPLALALAYLAWATAGTMSAALALRHALSDRNPS